MTTAIATIESAGVAIDHQAILKSLNLDVRQPATQALLLICDRYGLDPLLKHIVLIQGSVYVTRDGYLAIAHKSGVFDGMEVLEQGSDTTHFTAKVAVYRKDMGRPFTFIGRYPKGQRMAKDYGPEMAVKVAEVQALRRAFNVTGVGAADERWDEDAQPVTPDPRGGSAADERHSGAEDVPPPAPAQQHVAHTRPPERAEVVDTPELPPSTGTRKRKPPTAAPEPPAEPIVLASEEDRDAIATLLAPLKADKAKREELSARWNAAGINPFPAVERFTTEDAAKALDLLADFQIEQADAQPTLDGDAA